VGVRGNGHGAFEKEQRDRVEERRADVLFFSRRPFISLESNSPIGGVATREFVEVRTEEEEKEAHPLLQSRFSLELLNQSKLVSISRCPALLCIEEDF